MRHRNLNDNNDIRAISGSYVFSPGQKYMIDFVLFKMSMAEQSVRLTTLVLRYDQEMCLVKRRKVYLFKYQEP